MSSEDTDPSFDRRTLLRATGTSSVAGALAALAGCTGSQNQDDTTTTAGEGTTESETDAGGGGELQPVPEVRFVTWTQSQKPGYFEQTRMMISEFEKLGLTFEIVPQQFPNPYTNTLFETREYDMLMLGMEGASYRLEPSFYLNTVLHSSNAEQGGWNISGFEHDEFDGMSEEQQRTLNQDDRQSLVYRLQDIQQQQQGWTVYQYPDLASGLNTNQFAKPSATVPGEGFGSMWTLINFESNGGSGELDYGKVLSNIASFNPLKAQSADDIQFIEPMYDTLTRIGPQGKAENWIAEDVTVEDDTTVTATITDGLTFHDGEDVTGEDVAFSFMYQKENKAPYVATYLENLESTAVDGRTVTFNLSEPYAPFTVLALGQVPVIPKHVWENVTEEQDISNPANYENKPPVGSGPFQFARHKDGSFLELEAVDDHPRSPNVDVLRFRLYGNKSTAQQALLRNEIDVLDQLPSTLRGDIENQSGLQLNYQPQHGLRNLLHNERKGRPFSDPAFRRALAHAIPRERIKNQVYDGKAGVGGSIIAEANEFWHNPDVEPFTYDLEQARTILRDAGYQWDDNDRLLYPTG